MISSFVLSGAAIECCFRHCCYNVTAKAIWQQLEAFNSIHNQFGSSKYVS